MKNRRAGIACGGKGSHAEECAGSCKSAFWGAGEYPSHCRLIAESYPLMTSCVYGFGRLFVPLFLF